MEYSHARDYLIELANNPQTYGWLKDLIIKVINGNGNITDNDLNATYIQFISNGRSTLPIPTLQLSDVKTNIKLNSLIHHAGVNALSAEQKIIFSDDITLIYGSNGSGKSGYFRILNEMVGGNHQMEILPNIYIENPTPINVDLTYSDGTREKTMHLGEENKVAIPLNRVSVFDSHYAKSFLEQRSPDNTIVSPYGLHLFTALTALISRLNEYLQTKIKGLTGSLPEINHEGISDKIRGMLNRCEYTEEEGAHIKNLFLLSEEQKYQMENYEKKLKELKETNFEDKIKLAETELSLFEELKTSIINAKDFLHQRQIIVMNTINAIGETREKCELTKRGFAILDKIGFTDSEEWEAFVKTGSDYVRNSGIDKNVCPYCRQPINEEAFAIISAYAAFLSDNSVSKLNGLLIQKERITNEISEFKLDFTVSQQFEKIIKGETNYPWLYEDINNEIKSLLAQRDSLLESLKEEKHVELDIKESTDVLVSHLTSICDKYNEKIETLVAEDANKSLQITEITQAMRPLIERQAISSQKEAFKEWLTIVGEINQLKSRSGELLTTKISNRAKAASQHLITENLKIKFQKELDALGLSKLKVELRDVGVNKGQPYMQLKLDKVEETTDILSEGEQKGTALALFIAERKMENSRNPIILDDPVNSLDHIITSNFIERLLTLNNQIIIFSHDLLLRTSLLNHQQIHECGINQLSSCNKKSKHLFMYSIESYGINEKGVINEGKQETSKNKLSEVREQLSKKPSTPECVDAVCASLRKAIELMIDEKIFNNQTPRKFCGKNSNIQWEKLKKLNNNPTIVDKLHSLYSRLSGGNLHLCVEESLNPISHEELANICSELLTMNKDSL